MADAGEETSKHERILEEQKKEALIAILDGDVQHFKSVLHKDGRKCELLGEAHTFRPVGEEHDMALLRAFRDLLADQRRLLPDEDYWAGHEHQIPDLVALLHRYLRKYMGKLSHIAAFLGHTQIITTMARSASLTVDRDVNLFGRIDSAGKSALTLAVLGCHRETTKQIMKILQNVIAVFPLEFENVMPVFQMAVSKCSYQICFDPNIYPTVKTLLTETDPFYDLVQENISIMWHIFCRDIKGIFREREWWCLSCERGQFAGLHPLHYAARLYGQCSLGREEMEILHFLLNRCPHCDSLNFIHRWRIRKRRDYEEVDGTVVHFALSTYQPRKLRAIHPGYDEGGQLRVISDTGPKEGPDSPYVKMLRFLRSRGADLRKPNHYNKRPLDCLPSDADPYLIHLLTERDEKSE